MAGISTIWNNGVKMLYVDISNLDIRSKDEIAGILKKASAMVAAEPMKSVLIITDVSNVKYDKVIFEAFKQYASDNTPYVKGSSLVGLNGMQRIMFNAIMSLIKRDIHVASSLDDAKQHLSSL